MPLLTGWFPSQSGGDEIEKARRMHFSTRFLAAHVGTVV